LALWAKVNDSDRTAILDVTKQCQRDKQSCDLTAELKANEAHDQYWMGIRKAIEEAELRRAVGTGLSPLEERPPFDCKKRVKFGVGPADSTDTRVYLPMTARHVYEMMEMAGYQVDFEQGDVTSLTEDHPDPKGEL
jgi:hypothetical protein